MRVAKPSSRPGSRNAHRQARLADIVDAAFVEFAANGYTATRLDDVAARVGVTKGSLYLYFPGKEQLFGAVLQHYISQSLTDTSSYEIEPGESAESALRRILLRLHQGFVDNPITREVVRLVIAEGGKFPELREFYYSQLHDHCFAGLRAVLEAGIARGEFRATASESLVLVSFAPILQASVWRVVFSDQYPLGMAHFETHCDVLLNGLRRQN